MRRAALVCLTLALPISGLLHSDACGDDEISRRSATKTLRGEITKTSRTEVELKPRTGDPVTVPVNDIERIRFDGDPPELNLARSNERGGLLTRALDAFQKVRPELKGNAAKDTDFLIARTSVRLGLVDSSHLADGVQRMEKFLADNPTHFRTFEALDWLGQAQLASEDLSGAEASFRRLGESPMRSHQMRAKVAQGQVQLVRGNAAEALTSFEEVAVMQPADPAEVASRYDALLGKARCQQAQQSFNSAIATLNEVIDKSTPDQTALQARAYVLQGDCFRAQQLPKDAVIAYLHVDLLFSREKSTHAESLFRLAETWGPAGHPDRASEAATRLQALYPNNDWTKKLGGG